MKAEPDAPDNGKCFSFYRSVGPLLQCRKSHKAMVGASSSMVRESCIHNLSEIHQKTHVQTQESNVGGHVSDDKHGQ